jgi:hypothetical protein
MSTKSDEFHKSKPDQPVVQENLPAEPCLSTGTMPSKRLPDREELIRSLPVDDLDTGRILEEDRA